MGYAISIEINEINEIQKINMSNNQRYKKIQKDMTIKLFAPPTCRIHINRNTNHPSSHGKNRQKKAFFVYRHGMLRLLGDWNVCRSFAMPLLILCRASALQQRNSRQLAEEQQRVKKDIAVKDLYRCLKSCLSIIFEICRK